MPKPFWNDKRKEKLKLQAATMTVNQMARYHLQPTAEIERMLEQLLYGKRIIKETKIENGVKITVYFPGYAGGVRRQVLGEHAKLW